MLEYRIQYIIFLVYFQKSHCGIADCDDKRKKPDYPVNNLRNLCACKLNGQNGWNDERANSYSNTKTMESVGIPL